MRSAQKKNSRTLQFQGFTLLEMSIVLIIMAAMLGGGISTFIAYTAKEGYKNTENRLSEIEAALIQYRKVFHRLPCPADIGLTTEVADFGKETGSKGVCTGGTSVANLTSGDYVEGMVPVRALGLEDDYAFDSWGRRIRYMVDRRYTENEGFSTYPGNENVALDLNGGVATASSESHATNYPAAAANNGDRTGATWGAGGAWQSDAGGSPWYRVDFASTRTIDRVNVFSVQDTPASPVDPTITMTCSTYCLSNFKLQYWDGATFIDIPGASDTGNTKVWRYFQFDPISTSAIRLSITGSNVELAELEVYEANLNVFALISHGANGHGGYPRGGGTSMFNAGSTNTRELTNCACDSSAGLGTFSGDIEYGHVTESTGTSTDNFDDIVHFKARADFE